MEPDILTREALEQMKSVDIRTVDSKTLQDIRDVCINTDLPKRERMLAFIRQIKNPYCYRKHFDETVQQMIRRRIDEIISLRKRIAAGNLEDKLQKRSNACKMIFGKSISKSTGNSF